MPPPPPPPSSSPLGLVFGVRLLCRLVRVHVLVLLSFFLGFWSCCLFGGVALCQCVQVFGGLILTVWCGVVWCGVVWCGVVWCGVAWCGVVWCGVVWCGVVWCGVVLTSMYP